MIDDPQKTDRLMIMLKLSLPIQAHITRCLGKLLAEQSPDTPIPGQCNVIDVVYSGDEGLTNPLIFDSNVNHEHLQEADVDSSFVAARAEPRKTETWPPTRGNDDTSPN